RVGPGDTIQRGRLVTIGFSSGNRVEITTPWVPLALIKERLFVEIQNATETNASLTAQYFAEMQKIRGLTQFQKIFRQSSGGKRYYDEVWEREGRNYVGAWAMNNNGVEHTFTVSAKGTARRDTGTPLWQGPFVPLSRNRIEMRNYLTANQTIVLDMVIEGVYASADGRIFIARVQP
ncbi:MAG: hypothetical protein ACRCT6_09195, partial [Notoacmeibacter sp.]